MSNDSVTFKYVDIEEELSQTITWAGTAFVYTDENGNEHQGEFFDPPWYHCTKCLKDEGRIKARLALGSKFCPNCGTKLDWENV